VKIDLLKITFGIVVGIAIMYFLRGCGSDNTPIIGTTIETVHHTDTVYSRHTDTVYVKGPTKYIPYNKPAEEGVEGDETYFVHLYDESDLNASIKTYSSGLQDLEYNVICPEITHTDTIEITNTDTITITNTLEKKVNELYLGASAGLSQKTISSVAFNLTWKTKKDLQLYYELGIPFNSSIEHRVGVKFRLKKK
jgi:hypothetical protein